MVWCWVGGRGATITGIEELPTPQFRGHKATDGMQALGKANIKAINREDLIKYCPFKLRKLCRIINQTYCNRAQGDQ